MSEWLCQSCWIHTETFHQFYERVLRVHEHKLNRHSNDGFPVVTSGDGAIKTELVENVSVVMDLDLSSVKFEETPERTVQPFESEHASSSSDDCDDNNDAPDSRLSSSDEDFNEDDEVSNSTDSEDTNNKKKTRPTSSKTKRTAKMETEDAQIREIFPMNCNICDDMDAPFKNWLEVRRHYRDVHKTSGYLVCCGNKFSTRYLIMEHVLRHINPKAHQCSQCDRVCSNKFALKSHIESAHAPRDSRTNKCSQCPSSFVTARSLKVHVLNKHSDTGEQYPCDICGKR